MTYRSFKALLDLAEQQGIKLENVANFLQFASQYCNIK